MIYQLLTSILEIVNYFRTICTLFAQYVSTICQLFLEYIHIYICIVGKIGNNIPWLGIEHKLQSGNWGWGEGEGTAKVWAPLRRTGYWGIRNARKEYRWPQQQTPNSEYRKYIGNVQEIIRNMQTYLKI